MPMDRLPIHSHPKAKSHPDAQICSALPTEMPAEERDLQENIQSEPHNSQQKEKKYILQKQTTEETDNLQKESFKSLLFHNTDNSHIIWVYPGQL